LLKRYNVDFLEEPDSGIKAEDLNGYDLVWLNNPGHPFGSENTFNVLLNYSGGVVLQGDDFSRGSNFNPQPLTGLKYIDNGSVVVCNGNRYNHDNNDGEKYRVTLDPTKIPGADNSTIAFEYGNDIDLSEITRQDLEVLAYAQGGPSECTEKRPAIVRYQK
jgi:hypothetical protein